MGLDSLELLVEVEKKFKISISDTEAEGIVTVGDFYEVILNKISVKKRSDKVNVKCKPQEVFYKLRIILTSRFDIPKDELSPRTGLKEFFTADTIRNKWKVIESDLGLKLPTLLKPKIIQKLIRLVSIILIISLILTILINDMNSLWLASLIVVLPAYYFLAEKIFDNYSTIPQVDSVRELIYDIISLNYEKLKLNDSDDKEIYWKLKGIISNTTGVSLSDINYGARICYDLGIE